MTACASCEIVSGIYAKAVFACSAASWLVGLLHSTPLLLAHDKPKSSIPTNRYIFDKLTPQLILLINYSIDIFLGKLRIHLNICILSRFNHVIPTPIKIEEFDFYVYSETDVCCLAQLIIWSNLPGSNPTITSRPQVVTGTLRSPVS